MNMRQKLLLAGGGLGLLGAVVAAVVLGLGARDVAGARADERLLQQLVAQRDLQAQAVRQEVAYRLAALRTLAAQPGTVEALKQFKAATTAMRDSAPPGAGTPALREEMLGWLPQQFEPEWARHNVDKLPDLTKLINARSLLSAQLQQAFIVRNPQPPGRKQQMLVAETPSPYSQAHLQHHRAFDLAQDQFDLQDLLLVDGETDLIVYSVAKDLDFATSLSEGIAVGTPLAEAYARVRRAKTAGDVALSDAAPYLPAANRVVVFAAAPVFDGEMQIGVIAWRAGIERLTAPLLAPVAPSAGPPAPAPDIYLVGADKRLRSDPRTLRANPAAYLDAHPGLATETKALAQHRSSGVTLLSADSPAVDAALAGQTGAALYQGGDEQAVLAAYAPLGIDGLRWVVVSTQARQQDAVQALMQGLAGRALLAAVAAMLLGAALMAVLARRWLQPLGLLQTTLARLARGDMQARTQLPPRDELGEAGHALDQLLDGRLAQLHHVARENESLNQSVVNLLQTVFQMSNKDLAARAEVTEDIIGTLSSSINQLGDEMSTTLAEVQQIAEQVRVACEFVGEQAVRVDDTAQQERAALEAMASNLNQATYQLAQVAALSQNSSEAAEHASGATEAALGAVQDTVHGMDLLRESIAEMEKRFKRLGERSQEISTVVNLITAISERTHVLALNASMQAAAAGEAGRGFAMVAEEVQRLSESARQATAQIAQLVQSIQVETGDTLLTVNRLISQVVRQSEQARHAGAQMAATREATVQLINLVRQIAAFSEQQATLARDLRLGVEQLNRGSTQTILAIEQQTESTATLVEFAQRLSESVGQFKLPQPTHETAHAPKDETP
ncbi:methyl-accepting chemotaxis protein [Schlegelella sp. S2-27]|uniref:Methyl-accepting chemotaxis protein n=1 Tax=Caldimonas mangrovi TaxID=2944811 RepID=A0ABT0YVI7_9BURK|nr:methyl-accepting chemotaxis protein [Caldimonas mangrovi]MCM5682307.1 methyl-accepting chemotaxis protein [Caldimonas mangrovi]